MEVQDHLLRSCLGGSTDDANVRELSGVSLQELIVHLMRPKPAAGALR